MPKMPFAQIGFQRITSLSSAQSLTIPDGTAFVWIQAETQNVRMCASATPTATVGARIIADQPPIELNAGHLDGMQFIEETASAALSVTYWGSSGS